MPITREDTGSVLRDQKLENFAQHWAQTGSKTEAYIFAYKPPSDRTRQSIHAAAHRISKKDHVAARVGVLQQSKAKASIDQLVISQREVIEKMLEFTERMQTGGNSSQEAKGLDMLGKATGAYKAPEKNDKPRERTDAEINDELRKRGYSLHADTPNRTGDGSSRGAGDAPAADVSAVSQTEDISRSRPN